MTKFFETFTNILGRRVRGFDINSEIERAREKILKLGIDLSDEKKRPEAQHFGYISSPRIKKMEEELSGLRDRLSLLQEKRRREEEKTVERLNQ